MGIIKAPFNFVPLADKVFFPNWAEQISHDIPFMDGVSGTINLRIKAESPIFVRNGHTKKDQDKKNDIYTSFCKTPDGKHFIPATSIKGAIRNVLETMSFGKMTQVQNQSFGIRDLSNGSDGTFYRDKIKTENIHCGWLQMRDDNHYFLEDCGLPWRISAQELDDKLGAGLVDFILKGDFTKDANRTATAKYKLFKDQRSLVNRFSLDEDLRNALKVGNRQFVKFDDSGKEGVIVFTGQSGKRKETGKTNKKGEKTWTGKYYEFVFPRTGNEPFEVSKFTVREFISIHKNSPDYLDLWRNKLIGNERIPVFFMYDKQQEVASIGLSYMYKYPAFNSVYQAIPAEMLDKEKLDLSESIFGTVSTSDSSLRGRVAFSHALAIGEPKVLQQRDYVLSTPHPSYYPLYLGNGYTWNSETIRLAGRKRYPVRKHIKDSTVGTGDMLSSFCPLDKGTEFECKVRFHNLKKVELGALLSALTFHGDSECFHNLGMAKPYGFGKVKFDLVDFDADEYLKEFEEEMNRFSENTWKTQVAELFAMAKGIPEEKDNDFVYMQMSTDSKNNEFKSGKDCYANGTQLGTFTQILEGNVPRAQYLGNVKAEAERKNQEAFQEQQRAKREKYTGLLLHAKELIDNKDWHEAENLLKEAGHYTVSKEEINQLKDEIEKGKQQQFQYAESEVDRLTTEAKLFYDDKEYEKAIAKYKEAEKFGIRYFSEEIEKCNKAISMSTQTFRDFLNERPLSSPNSLKSRIKKWCELHGTLSDDDKKLVRDTTQSFAATLSKKKARDWDNFNVDDF